MGSGSIGKEHAFDWKQSAEKFVKDQIGNRSTIIPNAMDAIEQLKKVTGNPTAIQAVGAGNYSAMMSQSSQWFGSQGTTDESKLFDCERLKNTPDAELTPEELEKKRVCLLVDEYITAGEVEANSTGAPPLPANTPNTITEYPNPQSGLALTLVAMANISDHKAWELNSNLYGNTVVGGNIAVTGLTTLTGNTSLSARLTVTGNVTFSNSFITVGNVTFSNTLLVTGNVTISNTIIVTGAASLSNTLGVTGATILSNTLAVTGNSAFTSGMIIGSPTGGNKGAGTLNLAGDIYKNDTAFTNPDYVFEKFYTGDIKHFIDNPGASSYQGLYDLEYLDESYFPANLRFPGIEDHPVGLFGRTDFLLEKAEELFLYVILLNRRLSKLEKELEDAKSPPE